MPGTIYVARRVGGKEASFPGFTKILPLTRSSKHFKLSPYCLRTPEGWLVENAWHAQKVYFEVPAVKERYSRWDQRVIWEHPSERHVDENGDLLPAYFSWAKKLRENPDPVRYPVSFDHRHKCLGSYNGGAATVKNLLGYIDSREAVYGKIYIEAVRKEPMFWDLVARYKNGENFSVSDPDGPHGESLAYYQANYEVADDWIFSNTLVATPENLQIMFGDAKHPAGHSYYLAREIIRAAGEKPKRKICLAADDEKEKLD